jgi:hypothetical protein
LKRATLQQYAADSLQALTEKIKAKTVTNLAKREKDGGMRNCVARVLCLAVLIIVFAGLFPLTSSGQTASQSITYDPATNTITVSGYSASHPATFNSLWLADQANQWGKIQKQGDNQFIFGALIYLNTDAYLNDTNKQITLASHLFTVNGQYFIGGSGTVTLGRVIDAAEKSTSDGVSFFSTGQTYWYYWIWAGHEYIYSSSFTAGGESQALVYATRLWNSMATGQGFAGFHAEPYSDFFNVICTNTYYGIYFDTKSITATYDRISLMGVKYGIRNWGNGNGATISNIYARNCTYLFINEAWNQPITQYLINIDADNWAFRWVSDDPKYYSETDVSIIYRQYTFDLTTTDSGGSVIPGANVTISDAAGKRVASSITDANGQIPTKALTYGFYNNTGGPVMYQVAPYYLTITAHGYTQYNTTIPASQKTDWHIALQPLGKPILAIRGVRLFRFYHQTRWWGTPCFVRWFPQQQFFSYEYTWTFGDDLSSTSVTIPHVYSTAGNYTVT